MPTYINSSPCRVAKPGASLLLLFALMAFFLVICSVFMQFLPRILHSEQSALRIGMVLQDLLVFILPAIITALLATRLPAKLLCVDRLPSARMLLLAILTLLASIPAMNLVIEWNNGVHLPESMAGLEMQFRQMEDAAQQVTNQLMQGASVPSLIVSVLIIGVLAGFSEELFFRGALQQLLSSARFRPHAAIWCAAFIFSALHMQFFGFVPRLLLGAFFGYLLWWSKSLWVPIVVHAFNNTVVVISSWKEANSPADAGELSIENIGAHISDGINAGAVVVSVLITAALLWLMWRESASLPAEKKDCKC